MRTITIRQLDRNLFKELENLPITITRYGKPYCLISDSLKDRVEAISNDLLKNKPKAEIIIQNETSKKMKDNLFKVRGELNAEDYI